MATESSAMFEDIKPEIGARIYADKATLLGGEYADQIRDILEQRGYCSFRKPGCRAKGPFIELAFASST